MMSDLDPKVPPALSSTELAHFAAFGFLHLRSVYSGAEAGSIVTAARAELARDRRCRSNKLSARSQTISAPVEANPVLSRLLLGDDRILRRVGELFRGRRFLWTVISHNISSEYLIIGSHHNISYYLITGLRAQRWTCE
eukprot:SAG31_NODE_13951_length_835_cov_1.326087_1_plen_139_part_00